MKLHKNMFFKTGAIVTSLILTLSVFSGCGPKEGNVSQEVTGEAVSLPLKQPIKLKYWVPFAMAAQQGVGMTTLADSEMFKELEKKTNVKIEFIHPVQGNEKEQLNLLLAANNLPDLIQNDLSGYSGGLRKAYEDKLIVDLADLQKKFAPNLSKIYEKYPELLMYNQTEDGKFFSVPNIRGDESLLTFYGLQMRADWLKELNLSVPETIDEWYNVLKAFKEKKGSTAPFVSAATGPYAFAGAYGITADFFVQDGKIVYGPTTPAFKSLASTMSAWYKQGLIDKDFATNNNQQIDSKILNDKAGSFSNTLGAGMKRYITLSKEKSPTFDLVGVPSPTLKKGDPYIFPSRIAPSLPCVVVTSANKFLKETMAWLDYGFTKEGYMLNNFGIEGVSYTMENGYPKYTQLITNNPNKISMGTIAYKYMLSVSSGVFVQDKRYGEQYFDMPQQQDAIKSWSKNNATALKKNPTLYGLLTPEELRKVSSKQTEISTHRDEMFLKFVMGSEPIENFDKFVTRVNDLGINDIIKIKQDAYDRFVKKFPQALDIKPISMADYYK